MPASTSTRVSVPNRFAALIQAAAVFRRDPRFEEREIEYKLRLGHGLTHARTAFRANEPSWRDQLEQALRSRDNNIITWRLQTQLLDIIRHHNSAGLLTVWGHDISIPRRFAGLSQFLGAAQLNTPGAQLAIGSTLLMALGATDHPPIRSKVFNSAFAMAGYRRFQRNEAAGERYLRAIQLLDEIVAAGRAYGLPVRHRLEAQGLLWCVTGGWKGDRPGQQENPTDEEAAAQVSSEPGADELNETEREAIVLARRGQGLFRDRLIQMWGGCAATGCTDTRILRASHLKPWRNASNAERVTPYNGLLLTATLDVALDRGLITFANNGKIILSRMLAPKDRDAAGIDPNSRLRFVNEDHQPFLAYHREHVFERGPPRTAP